MGIHRRGDLPQPPLQPQPRICLLPVIARSEATWQSVLLQQHKAESSA